MARKNVRVIIPANADELIELGEGIIAKHTADGADSPLNGLDMAAFAARVAEAKTQNALQKQLRKDAELATEMRDGLLGRRKDQNVNTDGTIFNMSARIRDILRGHNKGNEQQLGLWGFEVNQTTNGGGTGGNDGGGGTPPMTTGSISGKVTDSMSFGIVSGAYIEVLGTGRSTTSNESGDFNLNGIPVGSYTVRVTAPGYDAVEGPVTITAGGNQVLPVQLTPSA